MRWGGLLWLFLSSAAEIVCHSFWPLTRYTSPAWHFTCRRRSGNTYWGLDVFRDCKLFVKSNRHNTTKHPNIFLYLSIRTAGNNYLELMWVLCSRAQSLSFYSTADRNRNVSIFLWQASFWLTNHHLTGWMELSVPNILFICLLLNNTCKN